MIKIVIFGLTMLLATQIFAQDKSSYKPPKFNAWVVGNFNNDATENLTPNSAFQMSAARLIFSGKFENGIGYHAMGEFVNKANFSPMLMQAWVSYNVNEYAQFKMGQFKYPFGTESYGPLVKWKFINPSYVTGKVVKKLGMQGGFYRDLGLQLAGKVKLNKDFALIYKAMLMNGNGPNTSEINNQKDLVAFAGIKALYNITISGSYYNGRSTLDDGTTTKDVDENAIAITGQLDTKKYSAKVEYITSKNTLPSSEVKSAGYFAYLTYKLLNGIEFGVRYDNFDASTSVENDLLNRTTISTAYYFSNLNRVMINYELRNNEKNDSLGNLLTILFQAAI